MEETSKKVRHTREIKFRALTKDLEGNQYMSHSDRYEEDEIPTSAHTLMSYFFRNLSPDAVLMQYTGLKDRTGTEIYEGDSELVSRSIRLADELLKTTRTMIIHCNHIGEVKSRLRPFLHPYKHCGAGAIVSMGFSS